MFIFELLQSGWSASSVVWHDYKSAVQMYLQVDNSIIHFFAGLILYSLSLAALKEPRRTLGAWSITLLATLMNELVDLTVERWPELSDQLREAGFDVATTMALPTTAFILSHLASLKCPPRRKFL